jgi:hypothetical protein
MSRTSKYIYHFLDAHLGVYNNWNGIEFVVNNDDSVIVNYWIKDPPQEDSIEFGLCYTSNTFNEFLRDFRFAGTHELRTLTPRHLWEMYHNGQAAIYCIIAENKNFFVLYFTLEGNTMIVQDDYDNKYELNEILQTTEQFTAYTRQQFQYLQDDAS